MRDPYVEEVQALIESLLGRGDYAETVLELCMIRRKISFGDELGIRECMFVINVKQMVDRITLNEDAEIDDIIFRE
jgi:hypothetical protein